jgi:hypothetical protein
MNDARWYYLNDSDRVIGPVSPTDLQALMLSGEISRATLVCEEGIECWVALESAFNIPDTASSVTSSEIDQVPIILPAPAGNGCAKGCGGCLAVGIGFFIICFIIGALSNHSTSSDSSSTSESAVLPGLARVHKEAPYATYSQGYDCAKRSGITYDIEPLVDAYRKMGYSEAFISGFRDGVSSNERSR